eukprot:CAMPEP_0113694096 /NCGR_PEP_ID=MMETSP0038_2-20120614/20070_1 /TAXON_ID=2898 /ORGANISM="Cryptomonas paramecium" /LENGTH=227 /DNA_ID=CAMNT_0000616321 /DNA_START=287 /DNA_END=967 /DNA_ORIENTATION=- /assembly_acc=CAM_ASM_000170
MHALDMGSSAKGEPVESLLRAAVSAAKNIDNDDKKLLEEKKIESQKIDEIDKFFKNRKHRESHDPEVAEDRETRDETARYYKRRYEKLLKEGEEDLSDGFPHQAQRDMQKALKSHEDEEKAKGFYGNAVTSEPKAWRLLQQTVKDDLKDHVQADTVDREIKSVVRVRDQVESARHRFKEEKKLLARVRKAGLDGMLHLSTREGGVAAEQALASKLDQHLTAEDRAWL